MKTDELVDKWTKENRENVTTKSIALKILLHLGLSPVYIIIVALVLSFYAIGMSGVMLGIVIIVEIIALYLFGLPMTMFMELVSACGLYPTIIIFIVAFIFLIIMVFDK